MNHRSSAVLAVCSFEGDIFAAESQAIPIDVRSAAAQLAADPLDPAADPDVSSDRAWARGLFGEP